MPPRRTGDRLIKWTIYATPAQRKAIRLLAVERDVDASRLVRDAIDQYLQAQTAKPKAPR